MLHRSKIFIWSISRSSSREQTWDRNTRNFKKKGSRSNRTARAGKKARHPEEEKTQGKDSRGTYIYHSISLMRDAENYVIAGADPEGP